MKTGIVMQIKDKTAVIMDTDGEFIERPARPDWQKGDVVSWKDARRSRNFRIFYAAAACFILFCIAGLGGYRLYTMETVLISMDINPSLELSVNRFGKVISVTAYNADAENLVFAQEVNGLSYQQAIDRLLESEDMRPYLESNEYLDFAVYTKDDDTEISDYLNARVTEVCDAYPKIQATCNRADANAVSAAHALNMSVGKYLAFLELQSLDSTVQIDEYASCGIGEIRKQIRERKQNGSGGHAGWNNQTSQGGDAAGDPGSTGGKGNGRRQYRGGDELQTD